MISQPLLVALLAMTAFAFALGLAMAARSLSRARIKGCPRCGEPMRLLDELEEDLYLSDRAQHEELLGSVDYDVWLCDCGYAGAARNEAALSALGTCGQCGARALRSEETTVYAPSTLTAGLARVDSECLHCGATDMQTRNLTLGALVPRLGDGDSIFSDDEWSRPSHYSIGGSGR
ncbi:MAG: hypothetical protein H6741_11865 [Alphaproteobacteria bacterium]|nr:hypothetical protein [Alphaproteobacteria bacterium]MCB9793408.1 hypothetical protein [Alphaproteobacteria bacterium]